MERATRDSCFVVASVLFLRTNVRDANPGEGDGYFVVLSLNSSTNLRTRLISAPFIARLPTRESALARASS